MEILREFQTVEQHNQISFCRELEEQAGEAGMETIGNALGSEYTNPSKRWQGAKRANEVGMQMTTTET